MTGKRKKQDCNAPGGMARKKTRGSGQKVSLEEPTLLTTLVWSGYLDTRDLGCLLLLTSKSLAEEATGSDHEMLWKILCCSRWGTDTTNALLQATQLKPQSCFRNFAYDSLSYDVPCCFHNDASSSQSSSNDASSSQSDKLPPLKYAPKDYVLIVEVRGEGGQMLLCKAIPGEEIPDFFVTGRAEFQLERPVRNIKKLEGSFSSYNEFYESRRLFSGIHFDVRKTVYMMRKNDQKVIKLVNMYAEVGRWYPPETNDQRSRGILRFVTFFYGGGSFGPGRCGDGSLVKRLDCNPFCRHFAGRRGIETQLKLEYRASLASSDTFLGFFGFSLSVFLSRGNNARELIGSTLKDKGMQFSDVLEALPDWHDLR